jgi:hypothetical protein
MKQRKTLAGIAALAVAIIGFVSFAPMAHAQVTLKPIAVNGVTCNQHNGGTYPENGFFYDCTDAHPGYGPMALSAIQHDTEAGTTYPDVQATLMKAPETSLFVFDDAIAMNAWFSAPGTCCTSAQNKAAYNTWAGLSGSSLAPTATISCDSRVWAYLATTPPSYPLEVAEGSSIFSQATQHELGHCFDWLSTGVATTPSTRAGMTAAMAKDKAYMMAHDANYAADYAANVYWLGSGPELFAEEFAIPENGTVIAVDTLINDYWQCSEFYTTWWMKNLASPTAADYTAYALSRCN